MILLKTTVSVKYRDTTSSAEIDTPNKCPHCGETMTPYVYHGFSEFEYLDDNREIGVLAQCTFSDCNNFFALGYVYRRVTIDGYARGKFILKKYSYSPPLSVSLPENIEFVSEKFVEIYKQSVEAESNGLDQIAGVGYRKATEFLIKDYAIRINPNDKDSIEKMFLGNVIKKYLSDFPKLQSLATASTWIGNDETHYIRRHEDKDINDMKRFTLSAAQFIAADYDADMAINFTSDQ